MTDVVGGVFENHAVIKNGAYSRVCDPEDYVFQFMQNVSATVTIDMDIDATSTAIILFTHTVPAGETHVIERLNFQIWDNASKPHLFGAIDLSGDNGILIHVDDVDDSLLHDFTDGENIKSTSDLSLLAGVDVFHAGSSSTDVIAVRWTIASSGLPMRLSAGQHLEIGIQDDLTGLDRFRVKVQGYRALKTENKL